MVRKKRRKILKTASNKRIASRRWKVDPDSGAKVKAVLIPKVSSRQKKFESSEVITDKPMKLSDFKKNLKEAINRSNTSKAVDILQLSYNWLPKAEYYKKHAFGTFLNKNYLPKGLEETLASLELIHGIFDNFLVISPRLKPFEFYTSSLEFFYKFRSIMGRQSRQYPIMLRELTGYSANPTFLLFTSIKGNGLLIKSLEDEKYSGGVNLELDILRIGKTIGANVPKNALVVHNTRHRIYKTFAKDAEILVEPLTPVSKSFSSVENEDLMEIAKYDGENLGKLFVFNVVAGSWDRHSDNYLITTVKKRKSLQEIDFGLYRPDFFKDEDFSEEDESRQPYPSKYPKIPGWGITRNQKVTKLMNLTDKRKFQYGIEKAIKKLHKSLTEIDMTKFVSEKIVKRCRGLFIKKHATNTLFWYELNEIENIDKESLELLLDKLELTR